LTTKNILNSNFVIAALTHHSSTTASAHMTPTKMQATEYQQTFFIATIANSAFCHPLFSRMVSGESNMKNNIH
jgi:hypothetical protein